MTLVSFNTAIAWPGLAPYVNGVPAVTAANLLDASGEYAAHVFNAREAMTISHIGFYPQASSSGVAEVRVETLTSGNPSGTLWGTNTNGTSGTLVAGTWALVALTASASITAGQDVAILVKYSSGTSLTLGNIGTTTFQTNNVPYRVTNTTGSAVKSVSHSMLMAVGSGATTFYSVKGIYPVSALGSATFNNTNSAARGVRFQVPFKCRLVGLRYYCAQAVGDHTVVLYDDAGAEVGSSSTAKTQANSNAATNATPQESFFDTAVTLAIGTWYRAAIVPSSSTNIAILPMTLPSADYRTGMPGGANFYYASRSSGTWTDETDKVPMIDLLIDQLDDGAGGAAAAVAAAGLHAIDEGLAA